MNRLYPLFLLAIAGVIIFVVVTIINSYRKCPPGHVLLITNPKPDSFGNFYKIIKNGGAFVWPFMGSYQLLNLSPVNLRLNFDNLSSNLQTKYNIELDLLFAVSSSESVLNSAFERLSGLKNNQIKEIAKSIASAQTRLLIASLSDSEINNLKFLTDSLIKNISGEMLELGLQLINLEVTKAQTSDEN